MIDFTGVTALRIPEGDVTKVVRKSDGVVLWEKVTSRLPKEFQEVEYIYTPSGAYINTGWVPSEGAKFNLAYSGYDYIFGCGTAPRLAASQGPESIQLYNTNNSVYGIYNLSPDAGTFVALETYTTKAFDSYVICNGTKYSNGHAAEVNFDANLKMLIGAWQYNASTIRHGTVTIYYAKASVQGVDVFEMIPCYRKSDGVIGMYDLVSKTFYTNAGSGSFTKGPDINSIETTIHIAWKPGYSCEYAVGKSFAPFSSSAYTVSEAMAVELGVTYKVNVQATAGSAFRFVGADNNGIVTETVDCLIVAGNNTFTFTPSNGTTQMRLRTYAGNENWTWKLSKG